MCAPAPELRCIRFSNGRGAMTARDLKGSDHEHDHNQGRRRDLLQGLGQGPAHRVQPRLAAVGRRLGRADAVLPQSRLSRHRARPPRPRPLQPDGRRPRHGSLCRRSRGGHGASRSEKRHSRRPFHRRRRGGALSGAPRREPGGEGGADQRGAAADGEDGGQSGRPAEGSVRRLPGALAANRSQFYRDVAAGPFYGYNRPGEASRGDHRRTGGARA